MWEVSPDPAENAAAGTLATEMPVTKRPVISHPDLREFMAHTKHYAKIATIFGFVLFVCLFVFFEEHS